MLIYPITESIKLNCRKKICNQTIKHIDIQNNIYKHNIIFFLIIPVYFFTISVNNTTLIHPLINKNRQ